MNGLPDNIPMVTLHVTHITHCSLYTYQNNVCFDEIRIRIWCVCFGSSAHTSFLCICFSFSPSPSIPFSYCCFFFLLLVNQIAEIRLKCNGNMSLCVCVCVIPTESRTYSENCSKNTFWCYGNQHLENSIFEELNKFGVWMWNNVQNFEKNTAILVQYHLPISHCIRRYKLNNNRVSTNRYSPFAIQHVNVLAHTMVIWNERPFNS